MIMMVLFDQVYGVVHDHDHDDDDIHDNDHDDVNHDGDFHPGWQSDHRSAT